MPVMIMPMGLFTDRECLIFVEVRVCCADPPSLYLRIQSLTVVCRESLGHFRWKESLKGNFEICKHVETVHDDYDDVVKGLVHLLRFQTENKNEKSLLVRWGRCGQCNRAWKMGIRRINDRNELCLFFTV